MFDLVKVLWDKHRNATLESVTRESGVKPPQTGADIQCGVPEGEDD